MSLNRNNVNPLSVLNVRKLNFIPEHFTSKSIGYIHDIKFLNHWINTNLNSRYAIVKNHVIDSNNKIIENFIVGFEDPKEITVFNLACPIIHK